MALVFAVVYPGGEETFATGYPGALVVVMEVPRGPEACTLDELEIEPELTPVRMGQRHRVLRVAGGPRRPALHVRLDGATEADRDQWIDARDAEGWWTRSAPDDPDEIWIVRPPDGPGVGWTALAAAPHGDKAGTIDDAGLDDDRRSLIALGARVI